MTHVTALLVDAWRRSLDGDPVVAMVAPPCRRGCRPASVPQASRTGSRPPSENPRRRTPRCRRVARSGPVGDRDAEGGDREQEIEDAEHGVLESILRCAALDRVAHHCAQEAPECEGEQRDCQGDERNFPSGCSASHATAPSLVAASSLSPIAMRMASRPTIVAIHPLAHEPEPSDRLLPISRLGHDGLADGSRCIDHRGGLPPPRPKLDGPASWGGARLTGSSHTRGSDRVGSGAAWSPGPSSAGAWGVATSRRCARSPVSLFRCRVGLG